MKVLAESIQNPPASILAGGEEEGEQLEELLENGGYASNEDAEDVVDDQYYAILRQLREEAEGQLSYDDGGGDDYISLLSVVDEVEFLLGSLQSFAQAHASEYQALGHYDATGFGAFPGGARQEEGDSGSEGLAVRKHL